MNAVDIASHSPFIIPGTAFATDDISVTIAFVLLIIYAFFIDPKIEKANKIQPDTANKGGKK